jgi:lysozyme
MNIDKLKKLLKQEEGFRSKQYLDTNGYLTIGYGHNLSAKGINSQMASIKWPNGISTNEAEAMLEQDIINAIDLVKKYLLFFEKLDEVRQAVLIDMCFNMGIKKLIMFHDTLYFIGKRDFKKAAEEMLDSKWAKIDVGARAIRLAKMMETGEWSFN